jgi:large subunit ribosomal protein L5
MNKMKEIRIEKLTLNMGTGGAGDRLDKAIILLEKLSGMKPVQTKSQKRIPTWSVRPGLAVGAKVTIRGKKAEEILKKLLAAVDNNLPTRAFDNQGSLSFGIPEYIDIPGLEYMVEVGIVGLEASVTLERPGFRIKKRKDQKKSIPKKHQISKKDAMEFMKSKFDITVGEEE